MSHFAGHAIVGSLVFVIIALPAFGLGQLVKWLALNGTSTYILNVLTFLEYAIVTIDAVAFLWHLLYSTYNAFKESMK